MAAQPAPRQFLPTLQRSAFNVFSPVQREFNRLFDELGADWRAMTDFDITPRVDLRDTRTGVELTVELPGIAEGDVRIDVADDVLTISGEKRTASERKEDNYRIDERSYGAFSRSVLLPRSVDTTKIKATMSDGVLRITAPKAPGAEGKTIRIEKSNAEAKAKPKTRAKSQAKPKTKAAPKAKAK